ncbi:hypothetical protein R6Q59_035651, partial [Mikania micrantha]
KHIALKFANWKRQRRHNTIFHVGFGSLIEEEDPINGVLCLWKTSNCSDLMDFQKSRSKIFQLPGAGCKIGFLDGLIHQCVIDRLTSFPGC